MFSQYRNLRVEKKQGDKHFVFLLTRPHLAEGGVEGKFGGQEKIDEGS